MFIYSTSYTKNVQLTPPGTTSKISHKKIQNSLERFTNNPLNSLSRTFSCTVWHVFKYYMEPNNLLDALALINHSRIQAASSVLVPQRSNPNHQVLSSWGTDISRTTSPMIWLHNIFHESFLPGKITFNCITMIWSGRAIFVQQLSINDLLKL